MSQRFFLAEPIECGLVYRLDSTESHHIAHVMRAKVDDRVTLFDGHGSEFEAEIKEISRKSVAVQAVKEHPVCRELNFELTVGVPIPKGDRQKVLVEKLTELGVTRLCFLHTARSQFPGNEKTIKKLSRSVIEASKQCGRNRLMQITGPVELADLVSGQVVDLSGKEKWIAHPDESNAEFITAGPAKDALVLIGPEGGFTDDEMEQVKSSGWNPLWLGKTILRMETAAIASAVLLARRHTP